MEVLFSIIGIVAFFSLYEYYTSKNWQQVTSESRNDVVFEHRNKSYGAYKMRKDYNKHLVMILFFFTTSLGVAYGTFRITREKAVPPKPMIKPDYRLVSVDIEQPIEEVIPEQKVEPTEGAIQDQLRFTEIEATDTEIPDNEIDIPDGTTTVGTSKIEGNDGETFDPPGIPDGTGQGIVSNPIVENPDFTETFVDEIAEFPGGIVARINYLQSKIRYPEEAFMNEVEGDCHLQFVVSKEGDISSVKVVRGVYNCNECDRAAVKVVKEMPRWKPGKKNGRPVNSFFNLKVSFRVK